MSAPEGPGGDPRAWQREALRLSDRYLREVVVDFGLCPWAERAISGGQVVRHVVLDETLAVDVALAFIDQLTLAAATVSVGMLIFARAPVTPAAFDRYTEQVRRADRERCRADGRKDFVMASFHPDADASFETPYQLVSVLRRAPDPMIQIVRAQSLDHVRVARPSLSEDIARQNFATVSARGAGALEAIVRDIQRDRAETYAALSRG